MEFKIGDKVLIIKCGHIEMATGLVDELADSSNPEKYGQMFYVVLDKGGVALVYSNWDKVIKLDSITDLEKALYGLC